MQYSDNYNLKLPQRGVDRANVDDLDSNFETIDGALADDRQISLLMYDSSATYNTGAIRGYENPSTHRIRAYRCLEDNVTGPWDATKWAQTTLATEIENSGGGGGSSTLAGLSDVDLGTLADGEVLTYDATEGKWVNAAGGSGGASELSDLDDVSLTTPTEGQILTYDGDEWVNADAPDVDVTKTAEGNPIEISDGANAPLVKCVSEIQGSQDLHGYDKPWVGGAGKNKLPTATSASYSGVTFTVNSDGSVKVVADGTATNTYSIDIPVTLEDGVTYTASGITGGSSSTYQVYLQTSGGGATSAGNITSGSKTWTQNNSDYAVGIYRIRVVSGATVNTTIYPMIEQGSTATAYEPYSNICPITAYTEGEIEVRGKNLCNNSTNIVGFYDASGVYQSSNDNRTSALIPVNPSTTYTASLFDTETNTRYADLVYTEWDSNGDFIKQTAYGDSLTTTASTRYIRIRNYNAQASLVQSNHYAYQLELGTSPTSYEPYTSTTHTTTYPSAIYRGGEDVVNGTETHDKVKIVFDGSADESWNYEVSSQGDNFYINIADSIAGQYALTGLISNIFEASSGLVLQKDKILISNGKNLNCPMGDTLDIHTVADWKTWLSTHSLEVAYNIAPSTSSVTPTNLPIKSLSGYNHIESSTGDMEIEYITGKYSPIIEIAERETTTIDEMLTENIESSMVASQNYTTGELIIACGKIYRATANIASGSNLTVGTNVVKTTIEDEIARSGGGVNYSTTEHIVGTWIDGSTLYEKTFHCNPVIRVNANSWATIATLSEDITIIDIEAFVSDSNGSATYPVGGAYDNNSKELTVFNPRTTADIQLLYVTIHYTKSS